MADVLGRGFLLKYNTTGSTFVTVGGATSLTITKNNASTDVTTFDDSGFQTMLAGGGKRAMTVAFNGLHIDDDYVADIEALVDSASPTGTFQIVDPATTNGGTTEAAFTIDGFTKTANVEGAPEISFTLTSSGAWTVS